MQNSSGSTSTARKLSTCEHQKRNAQLSCCQKRMLGACLKDGKKRHTNASVRAELVSMSRQQVRLTITDPNKCVVGLSLVNWSVGLFSFVLILDGSCETVSISYFSLQFCLFRDPIRIHTTKCFSSWQWHCSVPVAWQIVSPQSFIFSLYSLVINLCGLMFLYVFICGELFSGGRTLLLLPKCRTWS